MDIEEAMEVGALLTAVPVMNRKSVYSSEQAFIATYHEVIRLRANVALALAFINEHCRDSSLDDYHHAWRCRRHFAECSCGYSKALAEIRKVLANEKTPAGGG